MMKAFGRPKKQFFFRKVPNRFFSIKIEENWDSQPPPTPNGNFFPKKSQLFYPFPSPDFKLLSRMTSPDNVEENSTLMVFLALPGQLFLRLLSALAMPLILPKVIWIQFVF